MPLRPDKYHHWTPGIVVVDLQFVIVQAHGLRLPGRSPPDRHQAGQARSRDLVDGGRAGVGVACRNRGYEIRASTYPRLYELEGAGCRLHRGAGLVCGQDGAGVLRRLVLGRGAEYFLTVTLEYFTVEAPEVYVAKMAPEFFVASSLDEALESSRLRNWSSTRLRWQWSPSSPRSRSRRCGSSRRPSPRTGRSSRRRPVPGARG